jgi:aldehyde:ferredoxin oxidoreductase
LLDLINSFAGANMTGDDVNALGMKVLKLERDFNAAAGLTAKDDRLPDYFKKEALAPHNVTFAVTDDDLDKVHNY